MRNCKDSIYLNKLRVTQMTRLIYQLSFDIPLRRFCDPPQAAEESSKMIAFVNVTRKIEINALFKQWQSEGLPSKQNAQLAQCTCNNPRPLRSSIFQEGGCLVGFWADVSPSS